MKFLTIVGARPQFIKAGPLSIELRRAHEEIFVHTGQHYDYELSQVFFEDLDLPEPDYHLDIGSGPHGVQTGTMLTALEPVLQKEQPDAAIVYGDTNSTLAGALAAVKLHIPVAHVEAGLRSFNRTMPEEINRVVADHVATWLFAPSEAARAQLAQEGITGGVQVVGDIMADALRIYGARGSARLSPVQRLGLTEKGYYVATVHRAENTDDKEALQRIIRALNALEKPVVLPLHPRTRARLGEFGIEPGGNIVPLAPLGYLHMLALQKGAFCILTDSGGVQKEAYYLRVPCVTLRNETEWVETVATGWNLLAGTHTDAIVEGARQARARTLSHPDLYGDGMTAQRIVNILTESEASAQ